MSELVLTPKEARSIVYGDNLDWDLVKGTRNIYEVSRWSILYNAIFYNKTVEKYYSFDWSVVATEQQEESPYEYDREVKVKEVHEIEKLVKVWEVI